MSRKHRDDIGLDNVANLVSGDTDYYSNDSDNESIPETEDHESDPRMLMASYLLSLETQHRLTQSAIDAVVSNTELIVQES